MYRNYWFYLTVLISCLSHATDIGSDTNVTLFNNQVPIANNDRIAGFAAINGGFFLYNNATLLFDSFFSSAGPIQLNGCTLNLNQDLVLEDISSLTSLGTINANFHQFTLAPGMSVIPSAGIETGCMVTSTTSTTAASTVSAVAWSTDSQYVAIGITNRILVYKWNGNALTLAGSITVVGPVQSLSWHPTQDWIAAGVNLGFFNYSFNRVTGAMAQLYTLNFSAAVASVAWNPYGQFVAIGTFNTSFQLLILAINSAGVGGASASTNPNSGLNVASVDWDMTGTYLAVGTPTGGSSQLFLYTFNSGAVSLLLTATAIPANNVNSVAWNKIAGDNLLIAVGLNSGTGRVRVYQTNSNATTLTLLTGAQAINSTVVNSVNWNPYTACLAAGLNSNSEGSGGDIRIYTFSNANSTITESDSELTNVAYNVLGLAWSPNGNYLVSGSSQSAANVFTFNPTISTPSYIFSNMRLFLNSDITLKDCQITFTGNNLIGGRGSSLTLLTTQTSFSTSISVAKNSSLLFQNISIQGIQAGGIVPLDTTSTFSFQNCTFVMSSNYTFTQGSFYVLPGFFNLEGRNNSFIYTSNQQSSILANGNMLIDSAVTFSYAPTNNSNSLLQLASANSTLSLNSGTIVTSSAGLKLTKGLLSIDGLSYLINGGTSQAQGIVWGDGVSTANNLQLEWQPAATLQLVSGFLVDNNV